MKENCFIAIWFFLGIMMLKFYAKRDKTVPDAFVGMMSGGISLVALHYLSTYLGTAIPVNLFNTAIALILGIPGTAIVVVVNLVL